MVTRKLEQRLLESFGGIHGNTPSGDLFVKVGYFVSTIPSALLIRSLFLAYLLPHLIASDFDWLLAWKSEHFVSEFETRIGNPWIISELSQSLTVFVSVLALRRLALLSYSQSTLDPKSVRNSILCVIRSLFKAFLCWPLKLMNNCNDFSLIIIIINKILEINN